MYRAIGKPFLAIHYFCINWKFCFEKAVEKTLLWWLSARKYRVILTIGNSSSLCGNTFPLHWVIQINITFRYTKQLFEINEKYIVFLPTWHLVDHIVRWKLSAIAPYKVHLKSTSHDVATRPSSGSRGGPGARAPTSPHFWGPRLYSEAQIAPFYTQITQKFSKNFCLASLGILFQFSFDIFWSKTLKNYSFLSPQIIFWGPNCTFLHSNNTKIFKKILPRFTRHTISILNWHILIKNIKKLFIFEAPDYILRPKLHLFTLK